MMTSVVDAVCGGGVGSEGHDGEELQRDTDGPGKFLIAATAGEQHHGGAGDHTQRVPDRDEPEAAGQ
jgi:hypothetical protein